MKLVVAYRHSLELYQVFELLVKLHFSTQENPDYISASRIMVFLNDFNAAADLLKK